MLIFIKGWILESIVPYDTFGSIIERTGTTENDYLYPGEQFDANLGFYYNRARYLNVETGRFVSMDAYEGNSEDPLSLHKYLYANADGVNKIDPSGNFSVAEVAEVAKTIGTLSNMALRVLNVIDKVQTVVDAINMVVGILNILQSGSVQNYLDDAVRTIKSNTGFTMRDAIDSLGRNFKTILSRSFVPWTTWLATHGSKVKGITLYLPNPGNLGQIRIPTGMKIGKYPLTLIAGGKNKSGTVIGVGLLAKGLKGASDAQQIWRMDYHPFHSQHGGAGQMMANPAKEISVWMDDPFHYHIMKPGVQ